MNRLYELLQRLQKRSKLCQCSSSMDDNKLLQLEKYCRNYGLIWNRSTINMIRTSLSTMIRSAFHDHVDNDKKNISSRTADGISFRLTDVNALPSRTEHGIFIIVELANLVEDVRYSLVLLLGKQTPSYKILHSRGYDLPESIRKSLGTILLDQLAVGLSEFLDEISTTQFIGMSFQLGLLVHFPTQHNELNRAEILVWPTRFDCPDLLHLDLIELFQRSIERTVKNRKIKIIACIEESVAALISVAFDYPNTFISLIFKENLQLAFVENIEILRTNDHLQERTLRALYRTILSFHFHRSYSMQTDALFQTIFTPIDSSMMFDLNLNYLEVFTCDQCLLESFRLLVIQLIVHERIFHVRFNPESPLNQPGAFDVNFFSNLVRGKYKKLKSDLNRLGFDKLDVIYLNYLAQILIRRSAQMLSCLIVTLSDRYNEENVTIAIDSYLYNFCPIYHQSLQNEIERLCKKWITNFHFVSATNKSYLGPAAVMGLLKTQKALINQDDNINHLYRPKKTRTTISHNRLASHQSWESIIMI